MDGPSAASYSLLPSPFALLTDTRTGALLVTYRRYPASLGWLKGCRHATFILLLHILPSRRLLLRRRRPVLSSISPCHFRFAPSVYLLAGERYTSSTLFLPTYPECLTVLLCAGNFTILSWAKSTPGGGHLLRCLALIRRVIDCLVLHHNPVPFKYPYAPGTRSYLHLHHVGALAVTIADYLSPSRIPKTLHRNTASV